MAFDKNKKIDEIVNSLDFDDEDDGDILSNDEDDELELPKRSKSTLRDDNKSNNSDKTKIIIGICIGSIVIVGIIAVIIVMMVKKPDKGNPEITTPPAVTEGQEGDDKVTAGAPNLNSDRQDTNTAPIEPNTEILTNLNKQPVDANYKISSVKNVRDFINYEKKRAISAEGLEFYWLEATYKDRPYKVQVPFKIFKELETKGTTIVDVEVVTLDDEDKSEIVTYMNVIPNSNGLINKEN